MMNRTMLEQSALAKPAVGIAPQKLQAQPTQRCSLNSDGCRPAFGDRTSQNKSVAQWLLDEHSKLYCQWVKA
jgi:hypothetical protein